MSRGVLGEGLERALRLLSALHNVPTFARVAFFSQYPRFEIEITISAREEPLVTGIGESYRVALDDVCAKVDALARARLDALRRESCALERAAQALDAALRGEALR